MSLWLERLNELTRYYTLLGEAEQYRVFCKGQKGNENTRILFRKFMYWLGVCLAARGSQLQKQYGANDHWPKPALTSNGKANHARNKQ